MAYRLISFFVLFFEEIVYTNVVIINVITAIVVWLSREMFLRTKSWLINASGILVQFMSGNIHVGDVDSIESQWLTREFEFSLVYFHSY